jgi:hypothetical protein
VYDCHQRQFSSTLKVISIAEVVRIGSDKSVRSFLKIVPYGGTSSGSDDFQNNKNLDSQNSRSDKNHPKSQILSSDNPSSGYFENYQNQNWRRKNQSRAFLGSYQGSSILVYNIKLIFYETISFLRI